MVRAHTPRHYTTPDEEKSSSVFASTNGPIPIAILFPITILHITTTFVFVSLSVSSSRHRLPLLADPYPDFGTPRNHTDKDNEGLYDF